MEGEAQTGDDIYLVHGHDAISVAGPLKHIGWNEKYIIFTYANNPSAWNVIAVKEQSKFAITETERTQNSKFQQILVSPANETWQRATAEHSQ